MTAEIYRFADDGTIPNSALPLLVYRQAPAVGGDLADVLESRFAANDWRGGWRNGIYGFHHFHSISHEVLGVARGEGVVRFGGEQGESVALDAGDVVVIPAGVGHCLERGSRDLLVVGAYPEGREWDLRRGSPDERAEVLANIAAVPLPATDPLHGTAGPLMEAWSSPLAARMVE
ncbi:MAG: cupin domain-containing protein [Geminicoccaceae bacterium]